jgi:hypothetical protein
MNAALLTHRRLALINPAATSRSLLRSRHPPGTPDDQNCQSSAWLFPVIISCPVDLEFCCQMNT